MEKVVTLFCFPVFYKLIPAHNVFVLNISQYLTFALHFVGQGPVSMYNNFIYAIGFTQHFNGFNWIHISLDMCCIHSTLHFINVSPCSVPPRPIALSSLLSRCWSLLRFEQPVQFIWVKQVKTSTLSVSQPLANTLHQTRVLLVSRVRSPHAGS